MLPVRLSASSPKSTTVSFLPPGFPDASFSEIALGFLPAPGRAPPRFVPSFDLVHRPFCLIFQIFGFDFAVFAHATPGPLSDKIVVEI